MEIRSLDELCEADPRTCRFGPMSLANGQAG